MQQHLGHYPHTKIHISCMEIRYEWILPMSELISRTTKMHMYVKFHQIG